MTGRAHRPPGGPLPASVTIEVATPHGPARAHLDAAPAPRGLLVLGHGAGGGVDSRDLAIATEVALALGVSAARVEQPYRVAGRRAPAPAHQLDTAWVAAVEQLRAECPGGGPLVAGGRSSGARVACRTFATTGVAGVLCLAFPLRPPPRRGQPPGPSRLPELEAVSVPTLVVQGERDRFGVPPPGRARTVAVVRGDHSLRSDPAAVADAVRTWLRSLLRAT